jgi:hypothetical protein
VRFQNIAALLRQVRNLPFFTGLSYLWPSTAEQVTRIIKVLHNKKWLRQATIESDIMLDEYGDHVCGT